MVNNGKQQTGLVLPTVKRPTVFLGGLGFEVDMTAIHETDAVGDPVVVLEGVFDEGSLDGRWPGEQRWGLRRMVLRARSVHRCTPPTTSPISLDRGLGCKTYL